MGRLSRRSRGSRRANAEKGKRGTSGGRGDRMTRWAVASCDETEHELVSLCTGVQRGPVGGMVVVVPWASITTWHVWVSFDCISDQLHKQEKNFAPDGVEWELWCKCVCVENLENRAQQTLWHLFSSKNETLVLCWWWH